MILTEFETLFQGAYTALEHNNLKIKNKIVLTKPISIPLFSHFISPSSLLNTFLHIRYTGRLPVPHTQISMTSSTPIHLDLGTRGMNSPTKSSIVLVAGSAVDDFQAVMNKIDSLAEDMLMIPYAVVVFVHNTSIVLNTTRHHTSPQVVSIHYLLCNS